MTMIETTRMTDGSMAHETERHVINIGTFCRECGTTDPQAKIRLFDVRLDDGDYPDTYLCRACVREYRLDGHTCRPIKEPKP